MSELIVRVIRLRPFPAQVAQPTNAVVAIDRRGDAPATELLPAPRKQTARGRVRQPDRDELMR